MDVTMIGQGRQQEILNNSKENTTVSDNATNIKPINNSEFSIEVKDKEIDKDSLNKEVEKVNEILKNDNIKIEYSTHEKFKNSIIIKVINKDTHEILMEVPPKKILDMIAKMCEMAGIFIDKKV